MLYDGTSSASQRPDVVQMIQAIKALTRGYLHQDMELVSNFGCFSLSPQHALLVRTHIFT